MQFLVYLLIAIVALGIGLAGGYLYRKNAMEKKIGQTEEFVRNMLEDATRKAEDKKKEALLEAKEEVIRLKSELDKEVRDRRSEVTRLERRVTQREEAMDKKFDNLEAREEALNEKYANVERLEQEAQEMHSKQEKELQRIASLSMEDAKNILISRVQKDAYHDAAVMVREIEGRAKEEADKKARNIIAMAIQKCAADHVAETTVSVVALPNDDMKGRIIGREGRNIRTLETATGVDLIIDDTPEAVIISAFDPVRREIARIALEKLIMDGRIHPARIEEMVEKARKEVDQQIREAGEQAIFETNLHSIHPELVKLLGRMRYRTSYGQNVLKHSIEVSHLAGAMAAELGADVQVAKRAGLLHDIGKAIDHEVEGTHVSIGAELAKKFRENDHVINCIMAHHNDVEPQSVEAVLVQAADAISAARPGARRESLENYIKRLEKLESIAYSFDGVETCYAIQSGREVRIIVKPEDVNDAGTLVLAKEIVKKIESEMEYPGQIKVNVIRETRSVEFAK
ncbi:MAG TPA: ribonuclease Y [Candidatus Pullichristensenella excrementigallinarum]|uniref:Ribonuclease Y n=1 Tax=Candidatus Pullichristensenella excrementigallinarum TaxID=2840907 RepID=A0A9D1LBJ6_9FIRM|nr:ribonuclease Y [Candidatus Pullichristensenella excrementigallinarum]